MTSGEGLSQSLQDVQLYAQFALDRNPELENKLAPGLSRQTLINAIQEKSCGNFLYVRYLLNMLQEQQEQINLAQLDTLPTGLDGIYLEFLKRLVTSGTRFWENKYAPILGALAVAQSPLTEAQLSNLTDQTELSMTLKRLHQLLDLDETLPLSQRTYALYHRSFIDFLLDKDRSEEYGRDEKREHLHLAHWCEKDNLSIIWEDVKDSLGEQGRREYARKYYVTHLYLSKEWQQLQKQRLFEVLDSMQYGQAKMHDDPSGRSYAQDVDLGRQAAAWKGWTREQAIELLPRLWQYTLLRVSLTSRADQYPPVVFGLLVILKRKQEAVELAELLTDPIRKISALVQIAGKLREQSDQETEWLGVLMRAREVASMIQGSYEQAQAFRGVATALIQARQWEQAEALIDRIPETFERNEALRELATALIQAQQWERAEAKIDKIRNDQALSGLATVLARAQQWERAEATIGRIHESYKQDEAFRGLAIALIQAQQWERAEVVISRFPEGYSSEQEIWLSGQVPVFGGGYQWEWAGAAIGKIRRGKALRELATALIQAQQWKQAEALISKIPAGYSSERGSAVGAGRDGDWQDT